MCGLAVDMVGVVSIVCHTMHQQKQKNDNVDSTATNNIPQFLLLERVAHRTDARRMCNVACGSRTIDQQVCTHSRSPEQPHTSYGMLSKSIISDYIDPIGESHEKRRSDNAMGIHTGP